jgi:acyl-CoA thioesterase FadM
MRYSHRFSSCRDYSQTALQDQEGAADGAVHQPDYHYQAKSDRDRIAELEQRVIELEGERADLRARIWNDEEVAAEIESLRRLIYGEPRS